MSEFHLFVWLYKFFGTLAAINITVVLIHLTAYFSARQLLMHYFIAEGNKKLAPLFSLCYALLPFWTGAELSLAGIPFLLYAFLNLLYFRIEFSNWLIIILFPFVSYLDFSNLFFSIGISLYGIYRMIKIRKINMYFFAALFLFAFISVIVEYRIFLMEFVYQLESNRANPFISNLNYKGVVGTAFKHALYGHYHAYSGQFPIILISVFLGLILGNRKEKTKICLLLLVILFISLLYRLTNWEYYNELTQLIPLLGKFQLRFYVLFPLIWFIVFVISCDIVLRKGKKLYKASVIAMVVFQVTILMFGLNSFDYYKNHFDENCFRYTYFDSNSSSHSTLNEYYYTRMFKQLNFKQKDGDYAVCYGIEPEIIQYNKIHTLDGYFYFYPKNNLYRICEINNYTKVDCDKMYGNRAFLKQVLNQNNSQDLLDYYNIEAIRNYNVSSIFSNRKLNSKKLNCIYSSETENLFVYKIIQE